jgi:hypothetical protein
MGPLGLLEVEHVGAIYGEAPCLSPDVSGSCPTSLPFQRLQL